MTFESQRVAIEQRLADNWSTTSIAFDNVHFTPSGNTPFVELFILDGASDQTSLGAGVQNHRRVGIISINIYVSADSGTKVAREYADTISAIYRAKQFSGIVCQSPSITRLGQEGNWFKINVSVPFWTDELY